MNGNKVLHILMTEYSIDSRVRNETVTLVKEGMMVDVYCLKGKRFRGNEQREGVNLIRFGAFNHKLFLFLTAYISMFFAAMRNNYKVVHAHDLTALPIAFMISAVKRVPLIYDAHELWSQALHRNTSPIILKSSIWIEKTLARRADFVITVSQSIADYLKNHFRNKNVSIIRNVPSYIHEGEYDLLRAELAIPKENKIILYQGLISEGRGVSHLLEAAVRLTKTNIPNFTFVFMGDGPFAENIRQEILDKRLEGAVYLLPPVSQDELLKYTISADIGVHAINNSCLNHDYCLPNKLFEYVSGGLAVVVTHLTELSKFVEANNIGCTFEDENAAELADKLVYLLQNPQKLDEMRANSIALRKELTWVNESKRLLSVYDEATK